MIRPLLLLPLLAAAPAAAAQEPFAGSWRILESSDPAGVADPSAALVGEALSFAPGAVIGPHPLGCSGAVYGLLPVPPPGLFQGALAPEEAEAVAARLGLLPEAPTLRVDCDGGSFDYHATAEAAGVPRLVILLDGRLLILGRPGD